MREIETDRATIEDNDGNRYTAVMYTKVLTARPLSGPPGRAMGSSRWVILPSQKHLNTDDDQAFEDVDRKAYRRV